MSRVGQEGFETPQQQPLWAKLPHEGKQQLAQTAAQLTGADFIRRHVFPLVGDMLPSPPSECKAEVEQNTGTGRLTLRYEFGPDAVLHAKMYTDGLGAWSYGVLKTLWESGFGRDSPYQVPEPVGFLPDLNLLVMRQVPGKPVVSALRGDDSLDLVEASRQAARWLAALHCSPLRLGRSDPDWESLKLFRVASRLIKAAAAKPEHLPLARDLLHLIDDGIRKLPESRPLVQTHGRYHHDHVFIAPGTVAVIDLDRCCPSDPAKDAAEYVRVLRCTAFKTGIPMELADEATRAFLEEYLAQVPEAAVSIGCYRAAFMFHTLLGGLKKGRDKEKRTWQELMDFYVCEIKQALEQRG